MIKIEQKDSPLAQNKHYVVKDIIYDYINIYSLKDFYIFKQNNFRGLLLSNNFIT